MVQAGVLSGLLEQGLDELEGHADAARPRPDSRIGQDGIEDGHGVGQDVAGPVVVGDDDVDALLAGPGRELDGLDPQSTLMTRAAPSRRECERGRP